LRSIPFAFVGRIGLERSFPFSTPSSVRAFGVRDSKGKPVTVFLIIPFLRLGGIGIWNGRRLIVKPPLGLYCLFVNDLVGRVFIPISWLFGRRIRNLGLFNPVFRLLIFRIIDFLGWVDSGVKVFE
jgi:hypothetical protein